MRLAIISFTQNGIEVSKRLKDLPLFKEDRLEVFSKCSHASLNDIIEVSESLEEWTGKRFKESDAIIFIGATGIAVRAISPFVKDKLTDIPVIVVDESAKYVIPILSGHVGGANELAGKIADGLNAEAVITTATDLNNKFAVDLFAKKNGLFIVNKDGIKEVSSKILSGEKVTLSAPEGKIDKEKLPKEIELIEYPPAKTADILISDNIDTDKGRLILKPREYILGIGCKKGKAFEDVLSFLDECLKDLKIELSDLAGIASIDLKKDEDALNRLSGYLKITFVTFTADELNAVKGDFSSSDFVKETTGVDNICERSALLLSGENGKLVYKKNAKDGVTIAFAKKDWKIIFYE